MIKDKTPGFMKYKYILSQEVSCFSLDELEVRERGSNNNHRYLKHDQSQMSKSDQAMLPNATQI